MGRSISFSGHDFSDFTTAEVALPAALGISASAHEVPGRAGAVLISASLLPKEITVKLFLDNAIDCDDGDLATLRHQVAQWLSSTQGGRLILPAETNLSYEQVLCIDASDWSNLFEDGQCELVFTAFDPIAYGDEVERIASSSELAIGRMNVDVDGTYQTYPVFECVACVGNSVRISLLALDGQALDGTTFGGSEDPYCFVEVAASFTGGEVVQIDCSSERVWIDGESADSFVSLTSDFFALVPGSCVLGFAGCSDFTAIFTERWV